MNSCWKSKKEKLYGQIWNSIVGGVGIDKLESLINFYIENGLEFDERKKICNYFKDFLSL